MRGHQILVSCCKGIMGTLETVDEVLKRLLPHLSSRLAFLSGPSFAAEVAASLPTAVTIAAEVRHGVALVACGIAAELRHALWSFMHCGSFKVTLLLQLPISHSKPPSL